MDNQLLIFAKHRNVIYNVNYLLDYIIFKTLIYLANNMEENNV